MKKEEENFILFDYFFFISQFLTSIF